jgi:hypothetical protein
MIRVIVCGCEHGKLLDRCLQSITMQRHESHVTHVSLDTGPEKKFLIRNTYETVRAIDAANDDILAFLDADDFLCDEDALRIVEDAYADHPECLLTYGSYVNFSSSKRGKFTGAYGPEEGVRAAPWRASHLKTCKYKLWRQLPSAVLRWPDGSWFKCAADRAFMIPLMEMAGWDRRRHIDWLLYCYDDTNPQSVWNTMRRESVLTREYIAKMPALKRLETI